MRLPTGLVATALLALPGCNVTPDQPTPLPRGYARAEVTRPASFPHRIWAACDFEAHPVNFGWFGHAETKNIPPYPGNTAARRGEKWKGYPQMTGCNPVPGPRMGKVNYLYCRYLITGTDTARFQHYSLSSSDNNHINVSGLTQGRWSEITMNFTCDARRNDGSPEAFKEGERMDDLKVFVGRADDGKQYGFYLDDVIFFSMDPDLPPEPEPFPRRVIYTAGFDTGVDARSLPKYFPGRFRVEQSGPPGSYWACLAAVPDAAADGTEVFLKLEPPRTLGAATKLRFRYWLQGADALTVTLHDESAGTDHAVIVKSASHEQWLTRYVDFDAESETRGADRAKRPAVGNKVSSLAFTVADSAAKLYIDEVCLFVPGGAGGN